MGLEHSQANLAPIRVQSAGLVPQPKTPIQEVARDTLLHLGVYPHNHHRSNFVTQEQVEQATSIWCMTAQQCQMLANRFPHAKDKIQCLSDRGDILHPSDLTVDECLSTARHIQVLVQQRLQEKIQPPGIDTH